MFCSIYRILCDWSLILIFEIDSKVYKFHNSDTEGKKKITYYCQWENRTHYIAQTWNWSGQSRLMLSQKWGKNKPNTNHQYNAMGMNFSYEYCISCSNTKITWSVMFKSILKSWDRGDILGDLFLCSVSLHNNRSGFDDSSLPLVALKLFTVN